jgi:hypothetical protein
MADWYKIQIDLPKEHANLLEEIYNHLHEEDYDFPRKCFEEETLYRSPRLHAGDIVRIIFDKWKIDDAVVYFGEETEHDLPLKKYTYKEIYSKDLKLNKFKNKIDDIVKNLDLEKDIQFHFSVWDNGTIYWSFYGNIEDLKISCDWNKDIEDHEKYIEKNLKIFKRLKKNLNVRP